jgi:hypothetical protein
MAMNRAKSTSQALVVSVIFHIIIGVILGIYLYHHSYQESGTKGLYVDLNVKLRQPKAKRVIRTSKPVPRNSNPRTIADRVIKPTVTNVRNIATTVDLTGSDEGFGLAPETGDLIQGDMGGSIQVGPSIQPKVGSYNLVGKPKLLQFLDGMGDKRVVLYCLDISASMSSGFNKLGMAKSYLRESISDLSLRDSFGIIAFHDRVIRFSDEPVTATDENTRLAFRFMDEFTSESTKMNGRTDLFAPLSNALNMEPDLIVLVTDGLPSSGILSPDQLANSFSDANADNVKLYAIGMGLSERSPGAFMLRKLAVENEGDFELIQD